MWGHANSNFTYGPLVYIQNANASLFQYFIVSVLMHIVIHYNSIIIQSLDVHFDPNLVASKQYH